MSRTRTSLNILTTFFVRKSALRTSFHRDAVIHSQSTNGFSNDCKKLRLSARSGHGSRVWPYRNLSDGGEGMLFEWVRQSWLGLSIYHGTAIMKPLWIGIAFIAFALVAARFDIRERRIPNVLNLFGLGLFLALHFGVGSGEEAFFAFVCTGLLLLVPTLLGLWGQGNWKMAMVCGQHSVCCPRCSYGDWRCSLPRSIVRRSKNTWFDGYQPTPRRGLPIVVFVLVSTILFCAVMSLF